MPAPIPLRTVLSSLCLCALLCGTSTAGVALARNLDLGDFNPAAPGGGWQAVLDGAGAGWTVAGRDSDGRAPTVFTADPNALSDATLTTPPFILAGNDGIRFRQRVNLEYQDENPLDPTRGYDGAVLEVSVEGQAFVDVLAAGAVFATGAYNTVIDKGFGNPLRGRRAWSGDSRGFQDVVLSLPRTVIGKTLRLRWRVASDTPNPMDFAGGYWLSGLRIDPGVAGDRSHPQR